MGEEERDRRRKRVRRRRESSSYYKWQSLPGAYDKSLSALPGIEIPPSIAVTMGRSACHHLVTTLHQRRTFSLAAILQSLATSRTT